MSHALNPSAKIPCPGCKKLSLERYRTVRTYDPAVFRRRIYVCRSEGCGLAYISEERLTRQTGKLGDGHLIDTSDNVPFIGRG